MTHLGVPIEKATDPDTEGWWKVNFDHDYAAEAVDAARKTAGDSAKGAIPRVWLDPEYEPGRRLG